MSVRGERALPLISVSFPWAIKRTRALFLHGVSQSRQTDETVVSAAMAQDSFPSGDAKPDRRDARPRRPQVASGIQELPVITQPPGVPVW